MVNTCRLPSPAQWAWTEANEHDAIALAIICKMCNIFDSITYMLRARIKRGNIGKRKWQDLMLVSKTLYVLLLHYMNSGYLGIQWQTHIHTHKYHIHPYSLTLQVDNQCKACSKQKMLLHKVRETYGDQTGCTVQYVFVTTLYNMYIYTFQEIVHAY